MKKSSPNVRVNLEQSQQQAQHHKILKKSQTALQENGKGSNGFAEIPPTLNTWSFLNTGFYHVIGMQTAIRLLQTFVTHFNSLAI